MHVRVCRGQEQCFQKVQSPSHSNTLDSEGSYKLGSTHRSGFSFITFSWGCFCGGDEVFPMTTLLGLLIWMRVRGYKGHKKTPTNSSI